MFNKKLKSPVQEVKENEYAKIKSRNSSIPRILFTVFAILSVVGIYFYNQYIGSKRIEVIKLKHNVIAGDVVNPDEDFRVHRMLYSAYQEEGIMKVKQHDGTFKEQQAIVPWEYRYGFKDFRYNSYQQEDSLFTLNSSSEKMQYKNPLIEAMPVGNEEYLLSIDSEDIDINQLFPGTTLRMRVAFEVPKDLEEECRRAVRNKKEYNGRSVVLDILADKGYITDEGGTTGELSETFETEGSSQKKDSRTAVVSETIFDTIEAVDMLSSSKESIFEVYMSLLKMPLYDRAPYLQTSFSEDVSGEFRTRITPNSLVLNLTKEEADMLHEFEVKKYSMKWTTVKTASSSDMLKDFVEISDQISEASKQ